MAFVLRRARWWLLIPAGACGLFAASACSAPGVEAVSSAGASESAACDSSGTWALKIDTPVKWNATFVLQAGSGTLTNWVKSTRVQTGAQIADTARLCGVSIPDYKSTSTFGGEMYGVRYPDSLFDSGNLPTFGFNATLSLSDAGVPTFTSGPVAAIVGATMTNPATDAWPSNGALLTLVDSDGDAKPGVTGNTLSGSGYSFPPVNAARSVRADRVYTAFRQVLTATGPVTSCDRIVGKATTTVINNKPAIDSHVLGCRHSTDGNDCTSSEYKLLDGAAPAYAQTGDMTITMVRVPDATTCANIRAMSFDPASPDAGTGDGGAVIAEAATPTP